MATPCHLPHGLRGHIPGAAAPGSLRSRRAGRSGADPQPGTLPHRSPRDLLPSHHPAPDPPTLTPVVPQSFPGAVGALPQHRPHIFVSSSPIVAVPHPRPPRCDTAQGQHPSGAVTGHGVRAGRAKPEQGLSTVGAGGRGTVISLPVSGEARRDVPTLLLTQHSACLFGHQAGERIYPSILGGEGH